MKNSQTLSSRMVPAVASYKPAADKKAPTNGEAPDQFVHPRIFNKIPILFRSTEKILTRLRRLL